MLPSIKKTFYSGTNEIPDNSAVQNLQDIINNVYHRNHQPLVLPPPVPCQVVAAPVPCQDVAASSPQGNSIVP